MEWIHDQLTSYGIEAWLAQYLSSALMILFIAVLSIVANLLTKRVVLRLIAHLIRNQRFKWYHYMLERKVFHKFSHIVPAIIIYSFSSSFATYQTFIIQAVITYLIVMGIWIVSSFLDSVNDFYLTYEISKSRPIKGYLQVLKIVVFLIGGVLVIANWIGQNPLILLSGIGALSAVILLVFRDSLLGLVAGIQLTSNDMVRVGDWIEMPKYGVDGEIVELSLNTVKVQNWDNTITTVPTYALISDSFKNWRGMQDSGGRRIKRSLNIDMSTIGFCTEEMIAKFSKINYLQDYILNRQQEINEYNLKHQFDLSNRVNGRALTNIGVFRMYIQHYLENHPLIHQGMTCIVRQLSPTATGLPLEIYVFTNEIRWTYYEGIQSDIFDHILAVAPEFGLKVFQSPTGNDFQRIFNSSR
jgi:miniconductance mechanosensitive channel